MLTLPGHVTSRHNLPIDSHPPPPYNRVMSTVPATLPSQPIAKLRYSHDAMIDMIVADPHVSQNQLAAAFGYSPSWVSTVMATDMFKAALAKRRDEIVDPVVKATLEERFRAMVTRSLEVLQEKLSQPTVAVPDNLALRAAELGAKALGLGGNAPAVAPTFSPDHLTNLAERLVMLQSKARRSQYAQESETIEVRVQEVANAESSIGQQARSVAS